MNARAVFGYLFFAMSIALCGYQLVAFPAVGKPGDQQLALLMVLTVASGLLSFMALGPGRGGTSMLMSVVAFAAAFVSLAGSAFCVVTGHDQMTTLLYGLLFGYAFLFLFIGVVFSVASRQVGEQKQKGPGDDAPRR